MSGQLFTEYFLTQGIRNSTEWDAQEPEVATFASCVRHLLAALEQHHSPNESVTEQEIIRPLLGLLGWKDYLPQQGTQGHGEIPDYLLFKDTPAKEQAAASLLTTERYRQTLVIVECKRWGLSLDQRNPETRRTPSGQLLNYLTTADIESDGRVRWGILTNGRVWRLYDHRSRPRLNRYFEVDLQALLEIDNADALRLFYLLFRRSSFIPQQGAISSFLERALAEGRSYEERVATSLSAVVFEQVFPELVTALDHPPGHDLQEVRQAALTLLYRFLFVMYAEDRGLLPVNNAQYAAYGLRKPIRQEIAAKIAGGTSLSERAAKYYEHFKSLSQLIDKGDRSIGLPPYNGGLFDDEQTPLLLQARIPDAALAPVIHSLSHLDTGDGVHYVNYRDMSVQQLGSIYERLLEYEPVRQESGDITIRLNATARRDSGSYYTDQGLVDLIVERTLKPLVEERKAAFDQKVSELENDRDSLSEHAGELSLYDPSWTILGLDILDPAMGSGHFLVSAVDFLTHWIVEMMEYVPAVTDRLDIPYQSTMWELIRKTRQDILRQAQAENWQLEEDLLTDQTLIRREVLKRCIYGVDKNPLTVELAKVSLWLHSFTVGAPLSFLDHHLRCGDSLLGLSLPEAAADLNHLLGNLLADIAINVNMPHVMQSTISIESNSDTNMLAVQSSAQQFAWSEKEKSDLRRVLDFLCGLRWVQAGLNRKEQKALLTTVRTVLEKNSDVAYRIMIEGPVVLDDSWPASARSRFGDIWQRAMDVAHAERFLHWDVTFPNIWLQQWYTHDVLSSEMREPGMFVLPAPGVSEDGFDAIIGNPPWDKLKVQEKEWFKTRAPALALKTKTARQADIQQLRVQNDLLATEFDAAKKRSQQMGDLLRMSGQYPFLSKGDMNLYSLFVERATTLIKPVGMVGLLTQSGIYADKTAAEFFSGLSTGGRISALFDFENRRGSFFRDVHASLKFCALIYGGTARKFPRIAYSAYLHDLTTMQDRERCFFLTPEDFVRVNPNTKTAPVFRTKRDAAITFNIYRSHPVLVDRSKDEVRWAWPVQYKTMFHMTNDDHLFRQEKELAKLGFYPVEGNRRKRGSELCLPLYEGKMVQAFDHRAASIVVKPENPIRKAQTQVTSPAEHGDPAWSPNPQYWVHESEHNGPAWTMAIRDVTDTTNARTVIVALVPRAGYGNTLPYFVPLTASAPEVPLDPHESLCLLAANLNSLSLNFVARQKLQGKHLNLYILEQLPVIGPEEYDREFGNTTARALVRNHVLRLTYTACDMDPFARDLGYDGPPFAWDEEERRHLCARLDALYFHLYGIAREEANYILDTFPILRGQDKNQFGFYRTRDLILAYMNALEAGDTETRIST